MFIRGTVYFEMTSYTHTRTEWKYIPEICGWILDLPLPQALSPISAELVDNDSVKLPETFKLSFFPAEVVKRRHFQLIVKFTVSADTLCANVLYRN